MNYAFVHAADLHLDTPFEGIGQMDEALAERLRDASLEAWDALVQLTLERDSAFLVLAGDIHDGADRGLRAQLRLRDGLVRLSAAGIATFIVHGNHDPLDGWSAITRWPAGVTVFGADAVGAVPVERAGVRLATVYGISYATRAVPENLARRYLRADAVLARLHAAPRAPRSCTWRTARSRGSNSWHVTASGSAPLRWPLAKTRSCRHCKPRSSTGSGATPPTRTGGTCSCASG